MNASCFFNVSLDFLLLVLSACLCYRRAADNQFAKEYDRKCDRQTAAVLQIVAKKNFVLETDRISSEEVMAVVGAANLLNIKNILITHAMAEGYKLFVEKLMGEGISGREIDLTIEENQLVC